MPTGYTNIIDDGNPTAAEYLWRCARGTGLCLHMRDDTLSKEPTPPPPPDPYYKERLDKYEQELKHLESLTPEQADAEAAAGQQERLQQITQYEEREAVTYAKYAAMRARVAVFVPPKGLEGLRDFALEQLSVGAPILRRRNEPLPQRESGEAYRTNRLAQTRRLLESARSDWEREQRRAAEGIKLFAELKQALADFKPEQSNKET